MIFVCSQEELGGKRKMQTISFENVADQWLTLKKMQVKPSTFVKYQTIWEVRLKPSFGQYQLVEISEEAVMTFFLDQMEKHPEACCRPCAIF